MNKKAFTLVELVGMVVILSLIALLAIPAVNNLIKKNRTELYNSQKDTILTAAKLWSDKNLIDLPKEDGESITINLAKLQQLGLVVEDIKNPLNKETFDKDLTAISIVKKGNSYTYEYKELNTTDFNESKGVNKPKLVTGMTPIKWSGTTEVVTNENDPEWYDYNQKKWANAKTADGSYWVWIPRYAYKIDSCYNKDVNQCMSQTEKNAGEISVKFLKGITSKTTDNTKVETSGYQAGVKDTSMYYFQHPAFTFGFEEITGFWIAKFEASGTLDNIEIKPDKQILSLFYAGNNGNIDQAFQSVMNLKNMTKYGWVEKKIDSHIIKPTEWGAAAYLSKSLYGINSEIWNVCTNGGNASYYSKTGYSSNSKNNDIGPFDTCYYFNTETGSKGGTTGNPTGIFDMVGRQEFTAAYLDVPVNTGTIDSNPLFIQSGIKYVEKYESDESYGDKYLNYIKNKNKYGDAIYEVSHLAPTSGYSAEAWEGNSLVYPDVSNYLFFKSGNQNTYTPPGIFNTMSSQINFGTLRIALIVK